MSRDFILIFSGGMVSLITTVVVLFIADYIYRRAQALPAKPTPAPPAVTPTEPSQPPESKLTQATEDKPA